MQAKDEKFVRNGIGTVILLSVLLLLLGCWSVGAAEGWQLRLVNDNGFGDANNLGVGRIYGTDDYLYIGTWNWVDGTKVYRSRDGNNYELISPGGLGGVAQADAAFINL